MHRRNEGSQRPCILISIRASRVVRRLERRPPDPQWHGDRLTPACPRASRGRTRCGGAGVAVAWRPGQPLTAAPKLDTKRAPTPAGVGAPDDARSRRQTVLRVRLVTRLTSTTTMIAPMVATTIEVMSSGPSILILKIALARKPPTRAPTIPRT